VDVKHRVGITCFFALLF